ncbi:MAG: hypothetical protein VXW22_14360 [Pseudomonadota bacterium]|nr:hypothetical protein [Pseudomonadota bacterium]
MDIAKFPENYKKFGRCSVTAELEWWKDDYVFRADDGIHFVFVGDIRYAWSDSFAQLEGDRIKVQGRYKLLDGEYPSIVEIESMIPPIELQPDAPD